MLSMVREPSVRYVALDSQTCPSIYDTTLFATERATTAVLASLGKSEQKKIKKK